MKKIVITGLGIIFLAVFLVVAYFIFNYVFAKVANQILGVAAEEPNYECKLKAREREFKKAR